MGLGPQSKLKKTVGDVDKVSSIYGSRVGRAWIQILALRFIGTVILGNLQSANYFFLFVKRAITIVTSEGFHQDKTIQVENLAHRKHSMNI